VTDELLVKLTIEEKIGLLHQYQAPIPRLGIGPFTNGTEVLHGVTDQGPATVFPQAIGLASTWNLALVTAVGAAVGEEVRAFHHKTLGTCGPRRHSSTSWPTTTKPGVARRRATCHPGCCVSTNYPPTRQ
jgi:hypothetical protein